MHEGSATARSTEQVFQDHMSALSNGDLPALIPDYAGDAVLWHRALGRAASMCEYIVIRVGGETMKLAEALILRADCQRHIEQLKQRLLRNVKVQEGDKPSEDPKIEARGLPRPRAGSGGDPRPV